MSHVTTEEAFAEFDVPEFNSATEADNYGGLGPLARLLPGLAETLMKTCPEPDVVCRRILKNDGGEWEVDYSISVSVYYPGNSRQTMFVAVEKFTDDEHLADYYQMPYCELTPRTRLIMQSRGGTDERWFVSQLNNEQLRGWFCETGITRLSNQALKLVEDKQHEIVHDQDGGGMEPEPKRADD